MQKIKFILDWLLWVYKSNRILRTKVKQGKGKIDRNIKIRISGNVSVGNNVTIQSKGITGSTRTLIVVNEGASFVIGNHSGITAATISCKKSITIGDYVKIGAGCLLMDSTYHSADWKQRMNPQTDSINQGVAPITIDDHVFIGARSIICKGVHIGEKSIIATGSVVVKDIPANCIAGGNPCKVIKFFEEQSE